MEEVQLFADMAVQTGLTESGDLLSGIVYSNKSAEEGARAMLIRGHRRFPASAPSLLFLLLIARPSLADDPQLDTATQKESPTAFAKNKPVPVLNWGVGEGKSYLVPAVEIPMFQFLLNRYDHSFVDAATYPSPIDNFRKNLHRQWVVDNDTFATNQILHPYQGSIYQGFARSAGLTFWQSFAYVFAGSLLWEQAGENTAPSKNDQIASGIAGNFLGEPLFRIASLLLESSPNGYPSLWRELGAAAISPPTGLNRLAFGRRFDGVFRSYDPAVFTRIDAGSGIVTHFSSNVNVNADLSAPPASQTYNRNQASAAFTLGYGLPGKPDYEYARPFDYFNFELVADTDNALESIFSRGLLVGTDYELGPNYRGIWGLYGSYDYAAPQVFRVSTAAASVGTTGQWWLSRNVALQGSVLGGIGYGGGGVIHGAGVARASPIMGDGQRDYHYGATPQGLLALRLILGDRAAIDTTVREYYVSHVLATESTGAENIQRFDIALTIRLFNLHGITLRYAESSREGRYSTLPTSRQRIGTVYLGYAYLGQTRFGSVDWRPDAETSHQ